MAIKYLAGNRITGVAADTKPTNVAVNSVFTETDTKKDFIWSGSAWVAAGVGATIEGSEITTGTIPLSALANGSANKSIGFNSSGVASELASSSGVGAKSAVMEYDTVGKYSSYEPVLGVNVQNRKRDQFATYRSDFSTGHTSGWTHSGDGAYVSGGSLHGQADESTSVYDLYALLGDNKVDVRNWTLRFTFRPNQSSRTQGDICFGLSSKDESRHCSESQNFVGFVYRASSSTGDWNWGSCYGSQNPRDHCRDDGMGGSINYSVSNNAWAHKTRVFLEIIRHGNRFFFRRYADQDFRECVDEYYQDQEAKNYFTDPDESEDGNSTTQNDQRLRYIKMSGSNGTTGGQGMMDGRVDYVQFWNGSNGTMSAPYYLTRRAWERDATGTKPSGVEIGGREMHGATIFRNFPVTGTENTNSDHKCIGNESSNFWDAVGCRIDSQDHPAVTNRFNGERDSEFNWVKYFGYPLRSVSFWLWKEGSPTGRLRGVIYGENSTSHFRARSQNWIDVSTLSSTAGKANATKCEFFFDGYTPRTEDLFLVELEAPTKTDAADGYTIPAPFYRGQSDSSTARVHIACRNDPNNDVDDNWSGQYMRFCNLYSRQSSSQSSGVPTMNRTGATNTAHYWYNEGSVSSDDNWTPYIEWKWGADCYVSPNEANPYIDCYVGEAQWKNNQYGRSRSHQSDWKKDISSADPYTYTWNTSGTWETTDGSTHTNFWDNDSDSLDSYTQTYYNVRRQDFSADEFDAYRQADFSTYAHRTIIMRVYYRYGSFMFFAQPQSSSTFSPTDSSSTPFVRDSSDDWEEICFDENYYGSYDERVIVISGYWRYLRMYHHSRANEQQAQFRYYYYADTPRKYVSHIDIVPLKKNYTHNGASANATTDIMTATQLEIQKRNDDQTSDSVEPTYTTVRTINVSALTDGESNYIRVPIADTTSYRIRCKDSGNKRIAFSSIRVKYHSSNDISFNHGHQPMTATDASLQLNGEA